MNNFFKKDSFTGFQILTAFLVPTVVYEIEMNVCLITLPKILEKQERINNMKKLKEANK